ncbi:MAG: FliH/SctL family protein [Balneolaceae bacterium]|nr:FliH/SctL family protein [Balneolaceae bacterium]
MESRVFDSEQLNFSGKNFARLSYEMLFEEQEESAPESADEPGHRSVSEEELGERLREVEKEWKERLTREKEEAASAAFEEGRKKGKEEALSEMEHRMDVLRETLDEADGKIAHMLEELKPSMAVMVFDLAEKVMQVPLASEKMRLRVKEEIEEILRELEEGIRVKVEVSPGDFELVEEMLEQRGGYVELTANEELASGEFEVDTRYERIVKRFDKILNDFRDSVAFEGDRPRNDAA